MTSSDDSTDGPSASDPNGHAGAGERTAADPPADPIAAALGDAPDAVAARVLERTRRWVERETPTGDANRAEALAAEIGDALHALGAGVELVDAPGWGRHVYAHLDAREGGAPLLLLGHFDTVHPVGTLADRPFRVEDGRAYGPGIFDMKAPLAVLVEALAVVRHESGGPRRPLRVLITCDEEVGSPSSWDRIETEAEGAAAVLVLEPPLPGGLVKTARKGVAHYELHVTGRAAHAGLDPERGVSAVEELARQILRIADLADPPRGTTLNVGVIRGGTAGNVIAERASAVIEVRYLEPDEGERVDRALHALEPHAPGAALRLVGGENRPPLVRTDGVVRLYRHAREQAAALGFELGEGTAGGASDGSIAAALGIPTLDGLGVEGDGAHAVDEHILVDDIPRRVALLRRLLDTL
ncbi:MAG: M20 family metallopeptidase [Gemmatimonadota bacterium]